MRAVLSLELTRAPANRYTCETIWNCSAQRTFGAILWRTSFYDSSVRCSHDTSHITHVRRRHRQRAAEFYAIQVGDRFSVVQTNTRLCDDDDMAGSGAVRVVRQRLTIALPSVTMLRWRWWCVGVRCLC